MWIVQDLAPLGVGPSLATVMLNRTDWRQTVKGNLENIAGQNGWVRDVSSTGPIHAMSVRRGQARKL